VKQYVSRLRQGPNTYGIAAIYTPTDLVIAAVVWAAAAWLVAIIAFPWLGAAVVVATRADAAGAITGYTAPATIGILRARVKGARLGAGTAIGRAGVAGFIGHLTDTVTAESETLPVTLATVVRPAVLATATTARSAA
jgi:hypothetical protein